MDLLKIVESEVSIDLTVYLASASWKRDGKRTLFCANAGEGARHL